MFAEKVFSNRSVNSSELRYLFIKVILVPENSTELRNLFSKVILVPENSSELWNLFSKVALVRENSSKLRNLFGKVVLVPGNLQLYHMLIPSRAKIFEKCLIHFNITAT